MDDTTKQALYESYNKILDDFINSLDEKLKSYIGTMTVKELLTKNNQLPQMHQSIKLVIFLMDQNEIKKMTNTIDSINKIENIEMIKNFTTLIANAIVYLSKNEDTSQSTEDDAFKPFLFYIAKSCIIKQLLYLYILTMNHYHYSNCRSKIKEIQTKLESYKPKLSDDIQSTSNGPTKASTIGVSSTVEELENSIMLLKLKLAALKSMKDPDQQAISNVESEINEQEKQLETQKTINTNTKTHGQDDIKIVHANIDELINIIEQLKQTNSQQQCDLKDKESCYKDIVNENVELKTKINELTEKLPIVKKENDILKVNEEIKNKEIIDLKNKLEILENEIINITSENIKLENNKNCDITQLSDELAKLKEILSMSKQFNDNSLSLLVNVFEQNNDKQ